LRKFHANFGKRNEENCRSILRREKDIANPGSIRDLKILTPRITGLAIKGVLEGCIGIVNLPPRL
jgi:hypothetical protein